MSKEMTDYLEKFFKLAEFLSDTKILFFSCAEEICHRDSFMDFAQISSNTSAFLFAIFSWKLSRKRLFDTNGFFFKQMFFILDGNLVTEDCFQEELV